MIQITRFRLRDDVDEARLVDADARLQADFAYQQPGLLRRTTARSGDGEWLVIELWRSDADADAALGRQQGDATVAAFEALVAPGTLASRRYVELDG